MRKVLLDMIAAAFPGEPLRCASNADDALASCRAALPDMVVMDIVLPGGSGLAALGELRQRYEGVQVVIHSAFDDPVFRREAARLGAAAFVSKRDWGGLVPAIGRLLRVAHQ